AKLDRRSGASLIPDAATIQKRLAMLPVSRYEPGEMVIAAGETTGRLLLLRQGSVEAVKEGTQVARISEPGAVFGELAALLDQPHTADVRALERSEFSVADAATLFSGDPTAALYIAAIVAGRLDAANGALVEVKRQLEAGTPRATVARTVDRIAQLLSNVKVAAANAASPGYPEATARTKASPAKVGGRSAAPLIPDAATIQKRLAMLPVSTYEPGEMVIAA